MSKIEILNTDGIEHAAKLVGEVDLVITSPPWDIEAGQLCKLFRNLLPLKSEYGLIFLNLGDGPNPGYSWHLITSILAAVEKSHGKGALRLIRTVVWHDIQFDIVSTWFVLAQSEKAMTWVPSIWSFGSAKNSGYPYPSFPSQIIRPIFRESIIPRPPTVFDPFCGKVSWLEELNCADLSFIGCEINPLFCEEGVKDLHNSSEDDHGKIVATPRLTKYLPVKQNDS